MSKFDGTNWTTYNTKNSGLAENGINAIAIDSSGNKWFGTWNGVSKFDGTNWTTYNTSNSGLAYNYVHAIAIDASGNKWFGCTWLRVSKFDGTNWNTYKLTMLLLPTTSVRAQDDDGPKLRRDYPGGNTSLDSSDMDDDYVDAIAIDASGNKWFGTYYGVGKFDGTNWTTYNTSNSDLADNDVHAIAIDASGNKWFGTDIGVSKFHE